MGKTVVNTSENSAINPIGIFDSGVGGLTIWNAIRQLLPAENTIYLADSLHAPYGERSREEIIELSVKNTEWLLSQGCKIIVVACNTATTNAIAYLREQYSLPFIGIEPAIKPAALQSKTGHVGVLATKGTLSSDLFTKTSKAHGSDIVIHEQVGQGLVELIEAGKEEDAETKALLETLLSPMVQNQIDHLVLGCTHYPLLIPSLKTVLPKTINLVDCSEAVARQLQKVLGKHQLLYSGEAVAEHHIYSNGDLGVINRVLSLLGAGVKAEKFSPGSA